MEARRYERGTRLRALASAAYTASAGHLEVTPEDDVIPARRRWVPTLRGAVVAGLGVLALGAVLAGLAWLGRPADPVPLPAGPSVGAGLPQSPGAAASPGPTSEITGPDAGVGASPADAATEAGSVVVHVAGEVREPGVVELPGGSRVADAVEAAGGARQEADLGAVNLARVLVDGEQVYVPLVGEAAPPADAGAAGLDPGGAAGAAGGLVNLNTATAAELEELPGIGPALAASILEWRDLNGAFATVEDLDLVSGIGPATMEELRPLVTV
ncbi:helix-hairpin-helix domain-containing protein [Georgenia alba]|uniref:Helix-hairpin-helix domain-containing protein n=1 Tax=Georgenia alba TaxID=2233858 RepID=A0ABW2Q8X1_9MICO